MKIALLFSSKNGMRESLDRLQSERPRDEKSEPPPDNFAECDSVETIESIIKSLVAESFIP